MKPLLKFNEKQPLFVDGLVWGSVLDRRYLAEVHRLDDENGMLRVFDHKKNDEMIYEEPVVLMHGAKFGPDYEDVDKWQKMVVERIDGNG